jgi:hypothetical protein
MDARNLSIRVHNLERLTVEYAIPQPLVDEYGCEPMKVDDAVGFESGWSCYLESQPDEDFSFPFNLSCFAFDWQQYASLPPPSKDTIGAAAPFVVNQHLEDDTMDWDPQQDDIMEWTVS